MRAPRRVEAPAPGTPPAGDERSYVRMARRPRTSRTLTSRWSTVAKWGRSKARRSRAEESARSALDDPRASRAPRGGPLAVRGRDQATAGHEYANELPQRTIEVGRMEEHPGGGDDVEGLVGERERLDVPDPRIDSACGVQLHHSRRRRRDDVGAELPRDARRELAGAGPTSRTALRPQHPRCDRESRGRLGVTRRRSTPRTSLVRSRTDVRRRRVGEAHSSMTRPGSFLPGDLPPSQAFTVAPTSANSPSSWTRPDGVPPGRVGEQQRVLARVVCRRRCRVAAVVGA